MPSSSHLHKHPRKHFPRLERLPLLARLIEGLKRGESVVPRPLSAPVLAGVAVEAPSLVLILEALRGRRQKFDALLLTRGLDQVESERDE